ncbi:hypothetical protein CEXT_194571 [Caerostris extrusa]|uniref:Uncharacterized protein n=1 Tax=Caerostris extrusa TaxID=172846 RepID=A0AAV4MLX0_CAEEX|nr:hypothetical protein CEXT_194571 [Caerostris extrusa]
MKYDSRFHAPGVPENYQYSSPAPEIFMGREAVQTGPRETSQRPITWSPLAANEYESPLIAEGMSILDEHSQERLLFESSSFE